jgi:hypothetical protein
MITNFLTQKMIDIQIIGKEDCAIIHKLFWSYNILTLVLIGSSIIFYGTYGHLQQIIGFRRKENI